MSLVNNCSCDMNHMETIAIITQPLLTIKPKNDNIYQPAEINLTQCRLIAAAGDVRPPNVDARGVWHLVARVFFAALLLPGT